MLSFTMVPKNGTVCH